MYYMMFGWILSSIISCRQYQYYSYDEIHQIFKNQAEQHKDIVTLHYPLTNLDGVNQIQCGDKQCEYFYAEVAYQDISSLPTILLVGGFHGDERIGPNVITELLIYLTSGDVLPFLKQRRILLYPMVNPYGYYWNKRVEVDLDANRDFNYNNNENTCLQTTAGRALVQLYAKYLIQLGISFHGGDNSVTYAWGSFNHEHNNIAEESPDDMAFQQIAQVLVNSAGGNTHLSMREYTSGRMTNLVYAVNGGYEDWAYAAGWDQIQQHCNGINDTEIVNISKNTRSLTYLIEAGYEKQPSYFLLGNTEAFNSLVKDWPPYLYNNPNAIYDDEVVKNGYGHVTRNVIATLALLDMGKPYLTIIQSAYNLVVRVGGCINLDFMTIKQGDRLLGEFHNMGGIWNQERRQPITLRIDETISQQIPLTIEYGCDSQFQQQSSPNPQVTPQSFFVQSRMDKEFNFTYNSYSINSTKTQIELVQLEPFSIGNNTDTSSSTKTSGINNYVWYIVLIFMVMGVIMSIVFCKYCANPENEEAMEMVRVHHDEHRL